MTTLEQFDTISNVAPHLTFIHAMWATAVGGTSYVYQMFFVNDPDWPSAQFGDQERGIAPYIGYADASSRSSGLVSCTNEERGGPVSFAAALSCATPSLLLDLWQTAMRSATVYFAEDPNLTTLPWDVRISAYWSYLQYPIFSLLIDPMFGEIVDVIIASNDDRRANMYLIIIVIVVLAVIVICFATVNVLGIDKHMRTVLHFLQHCPPDVVLTSPRIMAVVNGDLSSSTRTDTKKTAEFFSTVIEQMPDVILFCTSTTYKITSANTACERIFGGRFIDETIQDFLGRGFEEEKQSN
jgi:hypothetical protein